MSESGTKRPEIKISRNRIRFENIILPRGLKKRIMAVRGRTVILKE
jgi:hypothetical protein